MTVIDGFTRRCLKFAAHRWPAHLREERYREWTAEMHMIRSDSSVTAPQRVWEQLRYAFSLAASPPAPDENRVPRGWRELLPQAGRRLRPWALLIAMGAVCGLLAGQVRSFIPGMMLMSLITRPDYVDGGPMFITVVSALALVGVTVLAAWLGAVIGRSSPLLPDPGSRAARVVAVVGAPIAIGVGVIAVDAAQVISLAASGVTRAPAWLYGPLIWMVLFAVIALAAVRLARRGRSGTGRATGIVAGLVALEVLTIPLTFIGASAFPIDSDPAPNAALWFPLSLVSDFSLNSYLFATGTTRVTSTLLVASAFVLWYAIASSRVRVTVRRRAPRIRAMTPAPAVSRPRVGFALTAAVGGLAIWAVGVAYATKAGEALAVLGDSQFILWASELRFASIAVTCLAMGLAMVGHGRPIVTVTVVAIGLLVVDTVLDAFGRASAAGLSGAVGFGVVILAAAWWLGRTLLLAPPTQIAVRRGHIGIAVTAAMSAPFILVQSTWPSTASKAGPQVMTPMVFPILTIMVAVLLVALAGVSAIAARRRRVSVPVAVSLIGVPGLALGGLGVISGHNIGLAGIGQFATVGIMLALPFTVWVLALMWWDRVRQPRKAGLVWGAIALAGVPATLVVAMPAFMLSTVVAVPLLMLQGPGYPADGVALLPGMVPIAVGMGVGTALLMARHPRPVAPLHAEPTRTPTGISNGQEPYPATS